MTSPRPRPTPGTSSQQRQTGYEHGYRAASDDWYFRAPLDRTAPEGRSTAYTEGWEQGYAEGKAARLAEAHARYLAALDEG